jgi:hypothetical protein
MKWAATASTVAFVLAAIIWSLASGWMRDAWAQALGLIGAGLSMAVSGRLVLRRRRAAEPVPDATVQPAAMEPERATA